MHSSDSVLGGALSNFELKESEALAARVKRMFSQQAVQSLDGRASALLTKVSRSLRNVLSPRYSARWQETKWPGNSTAVPSTQDERFVLLQSLAAFYGKHSDYEVPKQGITAVACDALFEEIKAARGVLTDDETNAETKNGQLDEAETQLRQKMGDLIAELERLIGGSDPRWLRFGLNLPDAPEPPQVPENVAVNSQIPGKLLVTCDTAAGASYYRFWRQTAGVDTEPVFVGSAQEPQFLIEGLTPGVAVKVFVSAVNAEGSECRRSAAGEGTPAAQAA
jgi:hypothetical protein